MTRPEDPDKIVVKEKKSFREQLSGSNPFAITALVVANLIPLYGVLFWKWDVGLLVITYWVENLIVGFFAILKILTSQGVKKPLGAWLGCVFVSCFFLLHYGGFCSVHGLFVLALSKIDNDGLNSFNPLPGGDNAWPLFLVFLQIGWNVIRTVIAERPPGSEYFFAGLFLSHAISYFTNYIGKGEFQRTNAIEQMMAPYNRIVVLHITIIVGALPTILLGSPLGLLILLVIGKTFLDLKMHLRERNKDSSKKTTSQTGPEVG